MFTLGIPQNKPTILHEINRPFWGFPMYGTPPYGYSIPRCRHTPRRCNFRVLGGGSDGSDLSGTGWTGGFTGRSWGNHGKITGKSWEITGKVTGKSWETCWSTENGDHWPSGICHMDTFWRIYSPFRTNKAGLVKFCCNLPVGCWMEGNLINQWKNRHLYCG